MPPPPPSPNMDFRQTEEFRQYLLSKQGKGQLFAFLISSSIFLIIFLISVLKPHRFYKKFISFLFGINVTIGKTKYKLRHFLLVITLFYAALFFSLVMQGRQNKILPNEPYKIKMEKLDKKWRVESQEWLAFLDIICLLSIFRNSQLFSTEKKLDENITELEKNKKKNE